MCIATMVKKTCCLVRSQANVSQTSGAVIHSIHGWHICQECLKCRQTLPPPHQQQNISVFRFFFWGGGGGWILRSYLSSADVARGFVASDVLLSRLQRKSVRLSTARVPAKRKSRNRSQHKDVYSIHQILDKTKTGENIFAIKLRR